MRKLCRSLSFLLLPSIVSLSTEAGIIDYVQSFVEAGSGEPPYSEACAGFPADSRKRTICQSYSKDNVETRNNLPRSASDLKSGMLYLIKNDSEIDTPYALNPGVGILPTPTRQQITLTPAGDGTDDDCGLCVMKFAEGTKVAGLSINLNTSSWHPSPGHGTEKAIFYGSTSESEFSESVVWGRSDFADVIHQRQSIRDGKMQSYHRLILYAEGSQNLLRVDNTSSSAVKVPDTYTWHVDVVNVVGTLSGNIPSSAVMQGGININNLLATVQSSSVLYEPLADNQTFKRYGVIAKDTPELYLYSMSHKVTKEGYERNDDDDKEELFQSDLQKAMSVFSDDNSYLDTDEHYEDALADGSTLTYYLGKNMKYVSINVETSPQNITKLTKNGGIFYGNALQLEAMCPVIPNNYNETNPYPAVNGEAITEGPVNATVKDLYEFCVKGARSTACQRSLRDRVIDGVIGGAIMTAVIGIPSLISNICLCKKLRSKRSRYSQLPETTRADH